MAYFMGTKLKHCPIYTSMILPSIVKPERRMWNLAVINNLLLWYKTLLIAHRSNGGIPNKTVMSTVHNSSIHSETPDERSERWVSCSIKRWSLSQPRWVSCSIERWSLWETGEGMDGQWTVKRNRGCSRRYKGCCKKQGQVLICWQCREYGLKPLSMNQWIPSFYKVKRNYSCLNLCRQGW